MTDASRAYKYYSNLMIFICATFTLLLLRSFLVDETMAGLRLLISGMTFFYLGSDLKSFKMRLFLRVNCAAHVFIAYFVPYNFPVGPTLTADMFAGGIVATFVVVALGDLMLYFAEKYVTRLTIYYTALLVVGLAVSLVIACTYPIMVPFLR